ncbi:MAG: hypothetical protein J0M15_08770 [Deltaproteobacteria bacterium]|nr:hypothetical protein [Deltaproteobacteria bacterium]
MKKMTTILGLVLISFTICTSASFAGEVLKTCTFNKKMPGDSRVIPTTIQIIKNGNKFIAKTIQLVNGTMNELPEESATISEFFVGPGLTSTTPNMNQAEILIQGTEEYLNSPDFGNFFNVGLDLKSIRRAWLFKIGKFTHKGSTVIIEAKDKYKNEMGSFVNTGFMPFACE